MPYFLQITMSAKHLQKISMDTGAAMSVVCYECLPDEYRENLRESPGAVGANGTPLDGVGKVNIGVLLGSYSVEEFTVIRN